MCPLTRCIGRGTVSVALRRHRSNPLQSKVNANPNAEFMHQLRFAPGCDFGEAQYARVSASSMLLRLDPVFQRVYATALSAFTNVNARLHFVNVTPAKMMTFNMFTNVNTPAPQGIPAVPNWG